MSLFRRLSLNKPKDRALYKSLKSIIGGAPGALSLYRQALLHSSISKSQKESNERLEYLGDAIIGAVVASYLYRKYPYKTEGFLTEIRSRIVNREMLNELAKKIGLKDLVQFSSNKNHPHGHKSVYGNALEALVGAIYIDKGYRFSRNFIIKKLVIPHIDFDQIVSTTSNFKSALIEWGQKENKEIRFEIIEERGDNHNKEFTAQVFVENEGMGVGKGLSKKKAEQAAAEQTFESLNI